MYPLPVQTVHLILQYISPLTDPIPSHLLSIPLLRRHHFLQISPSSPLEYLCWPSPDNAKIINLLDRLPLIFDQASCSTRYTSDPESTLAHVQISSAAQGLRMLFLWDDTHGWKYHDLRLMPFPSPSFPTPQESLVISSACGTASLSPSLDPVTEVDQATNSSDDSYWDAYGAAEHDRASPLSARGESKFAAAEGEDAYWSLYASVQGSADSTVPSPLPINRKLRLVNSRESAPFPLQSDPVINVPVDVTAPASTLGPPSPNMLADLLSTISPRKDVYSAVIDDPCLLPSPSAHSTDPSSDQTIAASELATPPFPDAYLDASVVSPGMAEVNGIPLSQRSLSSLGEAEDKALTDSVRGLYCLWKAGRKEGPDKKEKRVFLQIVQAAIAYE